MTAGYKGERVSSKQKKTLHLPTWICELVNREGDLLGGKTGLAAAAAILMFSEADTERKVRYVRRIQEKEVTDAYYQSDGRNPVDESSE